MKHCFMAGLIYAGKGEGSPLPAFFPSVFPGV